MRILTLLVASTFVLAGCVGHTAPRWPAPECALTCPPDAVPVTDKPYALYDGETGEPTTLTDFARKAIDADLVAFGELHGHPVGSAFELALLQRLSARRPVVLAMEFFERDHQEALKAYLAGSMDEETFLEETKRNEAYRRDHAPLVKYQKRRHGYVIAANAPRRLVKAYRTSGVDYPEFLASLDAKDRGYLPKQSAVIEDAYWERFLALMGEKMAKPFFKSQSLWDDTMAESMARFRGANPSHQILFVVGGFHVTEGLGTITKYKLRRPNDRVAILLMDATMEGQGDLAFTEEDKGQADALLKVYLPKPKRRPSGPHSMPPKKKAEESETAKPPAEPKGSGKGM